MTRDQKLDAIWKDTPRDYRGTVEGTRTIMVNRNGATCLMALRDMTDAEIEHHLPRALRAGG